MGGVNMYLSFGCRSYDLGCPAVDDVSSSDGGIVILLSSSSYVGVAY